MKVLKFGGTSQSIQGYKIIQNIIKETLKTKDKLIIVLSALSGTTNLLEKYVQTKEYKYINDVLIKHNEFVMCLNETFNTHIDIKSVLNRLYKLCDEYNVDENPTVHLKARIIGFGEVLSTNILYELVIKRSHTSTECSHIQAEKLGSGESDKKELISSESGSNVVNSDILEVSSLLEKIDLLNSHMFIHSKKETSKLYPSVEFYCCDLIKDVIKEKQIYITQGFIATTPNQNFILLGRGGSDTTGALIANTLNANEYQVWTDVDGIYTADPRIVKSAKKINKIGYEYVQEMAGMGAKVMHPYSIMPCAKKNIPIIIKNTFNETNEGTIIDNSTDNINSVASQKNITLFKITSLHMWEGSGFVYDIFKKFSDKKVNVGIITTSQFSISATTDEKDTNILQELFEDLSDTYEVEMKQKQSIVSIVSSSLKDVIDKINLNEFEKEIIHFSSNNMTVSFVLDEKESDNIVRLLHSKFI
jgi:aspartate kinase